MRATYLIDTHVLLRAWHTPQRISRHQRDILDSDAVLHVNIATVWEISIKVALDKLETVDNVSKAIEEPATGSCRSRRSTPKQCASSRTITATHSTAC